MFPLSNFYLTQTKRATPNQEWPFRLFFLKYFTEAKIHQSLNYLR